MLSEKKNTLIENFPGADDLPALLLWRAWCLLYAILQRHCGPIVNFSTKSNDEPDIANY